MRAADMTTEYIKEQIIKNHFNKTCFHDDETDITIILYPLASIAKITDFSQIEYFRLLCSEATMCGSSDIETAASHTRNIKRAIKENKDDTEQLREYYEKHLTPEKRKENESEWLSHMDFYSDWYKDVYGYRPRIFRTA